MEERREEVMGGKMQVEKAYILKLRQALNEPKFCLLETRERKWGKGTVYRGEQGNEGIKAVTRDRKGN